MNKDLGQVFTPKEVVKKMIDLISIENPSILEPSSGDGAFYNELILKHRDVTAIEFDENIAHEGALIGDFFDYHKKHDVIIGNPPYVEFSKIDKSIFDKYNTKTIHKPNLYMLFLEKSLDQLNEDGEIIFIIPTEWLTASSFSSVNSKIRESFTITFFEIQEENIWEGASVTTAIVKLKKGSHQGIEYFFTKKNKIFIGNKPKLHFKGDTKVSVGAASGNNNAFYGIGDDLFVNSSTEKSFNLVRSNYSQTKDKWIRKIPTPPIWAKGQIFVNSKTRNEKPFYSLGTKDQKYDASVICIYTSWSDNKDLVKELNQVNWKELGVKRNGRHFFTQSLLSELIDII